MVEIHMKHLIQRIPLATLSSTAALVLSVLIPMTAPSVAQAEVKLATVDVARIINLSPVAQKKKKELSKASDSVRERLEKKAESLKKAQKKLEAKKVSATSKEAESFRKQAKEFERLRDDLKADLEKKYVRINKEVSDSVLKAIEKFAKSKGYDIVIDKSEKYQGPVLYGTKSVDITDKIIDEIS
jgi:outer membrane protein